MKNRLLLTYLLMVLFREFLWGNEYVNVKVLFWLVLTCLSSFSCFGQDKNRLQILNGIDYQNSINASMRQSNNLEYSTVHYQFSEQECSGSFYNDFQDYPDDVKAWAPFDLNPRFHEAYYYDVRFRGSEFLCYGIENYRDIGLKYAFSNGHYGSSNMVIAMIDAGLRPSIGVDQAMYINEKEIPGNNIDDDGNGYVDDYRGYDFFYKTGSESRLVSTDNSSHGSNMARIMVGELGDTLYYDWDVDKTFPVGDVSDFGICPKCRLMNLKIFGSGDEKEIGLGMNEAAAAVRYAVDNGANLIMLATGIGDIVRPEVISPNGYEENKIPLYFKLEYEQAWYDALQYAWNNGVLTVGSAGNRSTSEPTTLEKAHYNIVTNHPSVIQVGGVYPGIMAHHTSVANPGNSLDIVVPDLLYVGNTYTAGTSEASALATGIIANFWSEYRELSNYDVKKRVIESAIDELWSIGSQNAHWHTPENRIVDVKAQGNDGILSRSQWGNNRPLTDDTEGWDEYYGYGLLEFESLYSGTNRRTVSIDPETGSVNGYQFPTSPALEDYSVEFQEWYNRVLDISEDNDLKISVYPNPASALLKLTGLRKNSKYTIRDVLGKTNKQGETQNSIDVSNLRDGIYMLTLELNNNTLWNEKLLIKH